MRVEGQAKTNDPLEKYLLQKKREREANIPLDAGTDSSTSAIQPQILE